MISATAECTHNLLQAWNLPDVVMYLMLTVQRSCVINMATPLTTCIKEEQHAVIKFWWCKGVTDANIHCRPSAQYGDNVLPQQSICKWTDMIRSGQTIITYRTIRVIVHINN
jgi:hypothetical protein